jgi:hypothetical protein
MSEMEARVSRARRAGRRAMAGVAVLAIAGTGVAWSGCGGDDEDEIRDEVDQAVDEIQQQAEEAGEEVGGQAEELQEQAEEQIDKGQKELEDAVP